ncbi:MAG TPA: hypothetical protein VH138_12495 [Vicinamibacterales bacterium]|jgi:hypothetical protein|nr:hypothetical protein [Vicinamibacterales bacterium]
MNTLFVTAVLVSTMHPAAIADGEHFTATASMKSATVSHSAPVSFQVDRFVSDADRDKFMAVVKRHKTNEIHNALAAMPDVGVIETANTKTPIKYAYATPTGGGRLITIVTAKAILHIGGDLPDAKPKKGFDLALAFLILDANDKGDGELALATKVNVDAKGAIVTEDYGPATVHLTDVSKAK